MKAQRKANHIWKCQDYIVLTNSRSIHLNISLQINPENFYKDESGSQVVLPCTFMFRGTPCISCTQGGCNGRVFDSGAGSGNLWHHIFPGRKYQIPGRLSRYFQIGNIRYLVGYQDISRQETSDLKFGDGDGPNLCRV